MRSLRDRADAWVLRRAAQVFRRRQWRDTPGRTPVVSDAVAHLRYRARTLDGRPS
jgi:hypothetical protein